MNILPTPGIPAPTVKKGQPSRYFVDDVLVKAAYVDWHGLYFTVAAYDGEEPDDQLRMCTVPVDGRDEPIYGPWVRAGSVKDGSRPTLVARRITLIGLSLEAKTLNFHYQVLKKNGVSQLSKALSIKVQDPYKEAGLSAPRVLNALNTDGTLSVSETSLRLRVDRPPQGWDRAMELRLLGTKSTVTKALDTVRWTSPAAKSKDDPKRGEDYLPKDPDAASIEVVLTEKDGFFVNESRGRLLRIWYTALDGDVVQVSDVAAITVEGEQSLFYSLSMGEDAEINADSYHVAIGVPPTVPPAQGTLLRAATGGSPPYTYTSSNLYVAAVDAGGKVIATGNGRAVITAIDANGEKANFTLTATGTSPLMCVRNQPFVDSDARQHLTAALKALNKSEYGGSMPGIAPSIGELRALWKQYRDLLPGLAGKLNWEQDTNEEAWYWTRDTTRDDLTSGTGAYVVNLNAIDENTLVKVIPYAELSEFRAYLAVVEGNHWLGFETLDDRYSWYQDGTYARSADPVQPWRARDENDPHEKEVGGKA